jgi:tRNA pseudouridine13 synthase
MKLKRIPEDFVVEEQISLRPEGGAFALYRLAKQSLGTPEAVDAIARRWHRPPAEVAFAGFKDKHARTIQYLTIRGGPRRGFVQSHLELSYVGQAPQSIHASHITGNRFVIVIRDLSEQEVASAVAATALAARDGLPNYFDNQRFGSLGASGEFIAKPWCLGNYERALWLALAEPNVHDRNEDCEQKLILREHWGDWSKCQSLLPRSQHAAILTHLAREPGDFRRAIALVRQDLRSLWLAAFQSHLWNQILTVSVRQVSAGEDLVLQSIGQRELPFPATLDVTQREQLRNLSLPLPSARLHLDEGPLKELYQRVFASEGLELRQVRVKYPRDAFFSKGDRAAMFRPANLEHKSDQDELYQNREKLTLRFTLPRGSYATILVKQLTGGHSEDLADDED